MCDFSEIANGEEFLARKLVGRLVEMGKSCVSVMMLMERGEVGEKINDDHSRQPNPCVPNRWDDDDDDVDKQASE